MAKTVTRADIRTRIRDRGEFLAPYFTDSELNNLINDAIAALWDILISLDEDWDTKESSNIAITSGTQSYSLPADFYILRGVDLVESTANTGYITLSPHPFAQRNDAWQGVASEKWLTTWEVRNGKLYLLPKPNWSGNVIVHYIPTPTVLSSDETTFDSRNLWTEWVILYCCSLCAMKQEQDPNTWLRLLSHTEKRIARVRKHNRATAKRVTDVNSVNYYPGMPPRRGF